MGGCCSKDKDDKPLDFDVGIEVNANPKIDTDNDVNFRNDIPPKTNGIHTQNELSLFQDLSTVNQDPELNIEKEIETNIKTNGNENINHESSLEMLPKHDGENVASNIDKCENGVTDNLLATLKDTTVNDPIGTSRDIEKEDAAIKPTNEIESILSVTNNGCEISTQQAQLKLSDDTKATAVTTEKGETAASEVFPKENEITISDTMAPEDQLKSVEDAPIGSNVINSNNRNISDQNADCDLKINSAKQVIVEDQIKEQYGATYDEKSDRITEIGADESSLTREFHKNQEPLLKNDSNGVQRTVNQDIAVVAAPPNSQPLNDSSSVCISSKHSEVKIEKIKPDEVNQATTDTFQHTDGYSSGKASEMKTDGEMGDDVDKDKTSNNNFSVGGCPESRANEIENSNQIRKEVHEDRPSKIGCIQIDDKEDNCSRAMVGITNNDTDNSITSLHNDTNQGANKNGNMTDNSDKASINLNLENATSINQYPDNVDDSTKESDAKVNVFPEEILVSTAPKVMSTYGISEIVSATKVARRLRANRQISTKKLWV